VPGFVGWFVTFSAMLGLMEFIFRAPLFHLDSLWAIYYLPLRWTSLTAIKPREAFSHQELSEFKGKIMRISSTDVIEGGRVLYSIGKIKAASAWHAANGAPPQANWRELVVSELIRKAEDIDADAIIGLDYETDSIVPIEGTGVQLKRILATGVAVKLSCAA
jgi:Putative heavy-metal-binding